MVPSVFGSEFTTPSDMPNSVPLPPNSQLDRHSPLRVIESPPLRSDCPLACPAESSSTASVSAENVVLSEAPVMLDDAVNATLNVRSESNESSTTCLNREDAGFDIETGRDCAQSDATAAVERADLVKGLCAMPVENQIASHDSSQVKAGVPGKLDRNGSSGERICRVCYLGQAARPESGPPIELGCDCKEDLAFAHRQCAETWFKIKGNKTCEICGSTVHNVIGIGDATFMENWNGDARTAAQSDAARCWQNHRLFNILLACMVFAFVLPWLFHVGSFFT